MSSAQHRDQAVKRLRGRLPILHHGDANVAEAGIRSVDLLACQIAARHHAQPRLTPELKRYRLVAAVRRNVEPEEESSGRTAVTVALTDDLIGKIVFLRIEATIFLDMRLVAVGSDADMALIDPSIKKRLAREDFHVSDYSPWEGWQVEGWPVTTILRGKPIVENGKLLANLCYGQLIPRKVDPVVLRRPAA